MLENYTDFCRDRWQFASVRIPDSTNLVRFKVSNLTMAVEKDIFIYRKFYFHCRDRFGFFSNVNGFRKRDPFLLRFLW